MGPHVPSSDSRTPVYWTANDRFKAAWRNRVVGGTALAAAAHLLLLVAGPVWSSPDPPTPGGDGWPAQLLALLEAAPGSPAAPVFQPDLDAPEADAGQDGDSAEGTEGEMGRWDWESAGPSRAALRDRLRDLEPTQATVVDPGNGGTDPEAVPGEDAATRIGGRASATDELASRLERIMELDRLSSTRPELALFSPSSVFLLRNPEEVDAFLRARLPTGRSTDVAEASVGVAIWINEGGAVEWAEISQSSGRSELDDLALELFSQVVAFHPARERGVRVPVSAIFWLTFPW
jgi:TonB family protein